jgi:hypothetical protein
MFWYNRFKGSISISIYRKPQVISWLQAHIILPHSSNAPKVWVRNWCLNLQLAISFVIQAMWLNSFPSTQHEAACKTRLLNFFPEVCTNCLFEEAKSPFFCSHHVIRWKPSTAATPKHMRGTLFRTLSEEQELWILIAHEYWRCNWCQDLTEG